MSVKTPSSINIPVISMEGKAVGEMKLNGQVFGRTVHRGLITEAVISEQANKRVGTHAAKTRAFVSGGGKKPYKQKGTGRARQGSSRAPQWRHGAVVFPPISRDHGFDMPRGQRRSALRSALSAKAKSGGFVIVDRLVMETPKTKHFVAFLKNIHVEGTALVVLDRKDDHVMRSARNIPGIKLAPANGVTIFDLLKYEKIVVTQASMKQLEDRLVRA